MTVSVSQIYIQVGVSFPFTWHFQRLLSDKLTALVQPSHEFSRRYGADFNVAFNMSAKAELDDVEIRGPSVYKKTKDVEYSIFLPYSVINKKEGKLARYEKAMDYLLGGIVDVLRSLEIDTLEIEKALPSLVAEVITNPIMLEH